MPLLNDKKSRYDIYFLTRLYVFGQYPNKRVSISARLFVEETEGMSYKQKIKTHRMVPYQRTYQISSEWIGVLLGFNLENERELFILNTT